MNLEHGIDVKNDLIFLEVSNHYGKCYFKSFWLTKVNSRNKDYGYVDFIRRWSEVLEGTKGLQTVCPFS